MTLLKERAVAENPEEVSPLKAGWVIPDGVLRTLEGKEVHLKEEVRRKPTVLIFYRGGWCPYCSTQMGQLAKIQPKLAALGYQLLAVSPDKPEKLKESADKQRLNYILLSDSSMQVCLDFGLAYRVAGAAYDTYVNKYHVDLEGASGENHHLLPVPAAFVLDKRGMIHYAYSNPNYKVRVNPEELLRAVERAIGMKP